MNAKPYTDSEINVALAAYAMGNGRARDVEPILEEAGLEHLKVGTLRNWAYRTHKDRYAQIKKEVDDHVRSQLEDQFNELARAGVEIQRKAMEELRLRLTGAELLMMPTKDLLAILSTTGVNAAVNFDKAQIAGGKPTSIVRSDFSELKRILEERHGVILKVKGEPPAIAPPATQADADQAAGDQGEDPPATQAAPEREPLPPSRQLESGDDG